MSFLSPIEQTRRDLAYAACAPRPNAMDFDASLAAAIGRSQAAANRWRCATGLPAKIDRDAPPFDADPRKRQSKAKEAARLRRWHDGRPSNRAALAYEQARLAIELLLSSGADQTVIDALIAKLSGLL